MAIVTVDQTGRVEGLFVFNAQTYPGETKILAAWHDLAAFAAAHPILKLASKHRVELYIGGEGSD